MKIKLEIFCLNILLLTSTSLFSQSNKTYYSLDEALKSSVDSVLILDLSKQKLTEFPSSILKFIHLKELYLSKNKISSLPKNFYDLKELEILDLSRNNFTNFPISLCSVISLKKLLLGRNNISSIPECVGQLENLEFLDLFLNPINGLPNSISNLKNLKEIDLRGINFSNTTQDFIQAIIPWAKIEFDVGCDCGK